MPEIGQIIAFEDMRDKQTLSIFLSSKNIYQSKPSIQIRGLIMAISRNILILLIVAVVAVSAIAIIVLMAQTPPDVSIQDWSYDEDQWGNYEFEVFVKNYGPVAHDVVVYGRVETTGGVYTNSKAISLEPGETERVWFQVINVPSSEQDNIKDVDCYLEFP